MERLWSAQVHYIKPGKYIREDIFVCKAFPDSDTASNNAADQVNAKGIDWYAIVTWEVKEKGVALVPVEQVECENKEENSPSE